MTSTNYEIWQAINVALDKDEYGGEFSPVDYNYIAPIVSKGFFKDKMEELYQNINPIVPLNETILSSKIFKDLITRETIAPTTGVVDLDGDTAATYGYWVSMTCVISNQPRQIKLVSHDEYEKIAGSLMGSFIKYHPIATIDGDNCRILPSNIASVVFTYLKIPADPVFDYYSDGNDNIVYLAVGASHTLAGSEVGSGGEVAPTEVSSNSVEFAYNETYLSEITNRMIRLASNRLKDQMSAAYSETNIQKEDSR